MITNGQYVKCEKCHRAQIVLGKVGSSSKEIEDARAHLQSCPKSPSHKRPK